jgi:hypothetical protein
VGAEDVLAAFSQRPDGTQAPEGRSHQGLKAPGYSRSSLRDSPSGAKTSVNAECRKAAVGPTGDHPRKQPQGNLRHAPGTISLPKGCPQSPPV